MSIPPELFPRLTAQNHRVTSAASTEYNCIAWSARDTERWWEPGRFWPCTAAENDYGIGILEAAFKSLGFTDCPDDSLEVANEKIAPYGDAQFYTHAARQQPTGKWTSKLGQAEDIEHDTPQDIAGGLYGEVVQYMKRPLREQREP